MELRTTEILVDLATATDMETIVIQFMVTNVTVRTTQKATFVGLVQKKIPPTLVGWFSVRNVKKVI